MYLAAKVKIIEFESKPVEAVILSQVVSLKDDRTDVGSIISLNWAVVHGQKTGQAIILNWTLYQVCFIIYVALSWISPLRGVKQRSHKIWQNCTLGLQLYFTLK